VAITNSEKRRAAIQDLLIGVGLPILQIIARECARPFAIGRCSIYWDAIHNSDYVVSANRYDIFEDIGPYFSTVLRPPTFVLFYAWPVAIGTVSLFYCGEYPA
jgi:pheromone a factor receptor